MKKVRILFSDLLFISLVALLILLSLFSYRQITKFNTASDWVNHTNLVKLNLEQILSWLKDAETAQRGFLLTSDSSFLLPANGTREKINELILQLDSLTVDNKEEQANTATLQKLIDQRYDRLSYMLSLSNKTPAFIAAQLAEGNGIMDQVRRRVADMIALENDLLVQRRKSKDRYASITPLYSLLLSILSIAVIMVAYFRLRSETRLRFRAQDSEATIHNFFMQVPAMVAILKGPKHVFEFANPAYLELIGNRDVVGKSLQEALPEATQQGYGELLDKVYKSGEPYVGNEMSFEIARNTGKKEQLYVNFIYQAFVNVQGVTEGILVFCYDVTEMVLTRKKVEETEQRIRLAIEAAEMGTFDWDFDNQQFLSSARLEEIFGFIDQPNVTHQDLLNTFHPADKPLRDKAVEESYAKGSLAYEARIIWPDKTIHWVNVYGKVIYSDQRQALRMYGMVIDITAPKKILEELKESESRFRLLADSMPQQIWTGDEKGNLNYFNKAVYQLSGLSNADMQREGWISIVHPDDREENIKEWMHAVETGEEFSLEHRFRNRNGEYRWQLSRALPQKDASGNIQRWVGTSTDIQEQKNFMQELEQKVKERTRSLQDANAKLEHTIIQLERSNTELESFNYVASHDLQEPLRKIIAFSQRISEKERDTISAIGKDYFNRIIAAASRMQDLIDAFLSYSQTNLTNIPFEQTDLNKMLEEVKNDFTDVIAEKNVVIESGTLPTVKLIPLQFHQLFVNLINNAIKYSRPGVPPVIKIASEKIAGKEIKNENSDPAMDYWKISIADNGIGFEQQYANKIFELFQRLHGKTDYIGTGIGLAICKKIMRNHNGFITATGIPGTGSVFELYIPVSLLR